MGFTSALATARSVARSSSSESRSSRTRLLCSSFPAASNLIRAVGVSTSCTYATATRRNASATSCGTKRLASIGDGAYGAAAAAVVDAVVDAAAAAAAAASSIFAAVVDAALRRRRTTSVAPRATASDSSPRRLPRDVVVVAVAVRAAPEARRLPRDAAGGVADVDTARADIDGRRRASRGRRGSALDDVAGRGSGHT
eukprot:9085-Pelagococcus_subviridis.AAC.3